MPYENLSEGRNKQKQINVTNPISTEWRLWCRPDMLRVSIDPKSNGEDKSRLNPQLRFPNFAGECDGTKRWYQTSSTSTRENQRKPTQQTPRQQSESQDFQTLNFWPRPDMHAMTGVSRCGIAPRRRKRKQGNIKPRLKPSAALPTLCGRL